MAKIKELELTLKLSKLVKSDNDEMECPDQALLEEIEAIIQELLGKNIIVEIQ